MLYESTKALLQDILDSLDTPRTLEWDKQVQSGFECLFEMHQMCRPLYRAYQVTKSDKWPVHIPDSERLTRAIPHVKTMLAAIRRKERALAKKSGNAALAEMNGIPQPLPVSDVPGARNVPRQRKKPARPRRRGGKASTRAKCRTTDR